MRWPPPAGDLDEDDEPDGLRGCKVCLHKYLDPSCAWSAFYEDKRNLRDSWCIGRGCARFITSILCSFCGEECNKESYEVSDEDDIQCCTACYKADEIKYKDAKYQKHGHGVTLSMYEEDEGEDQNKNPGEVTKKGEKIKEAEEEDISTNSIREGPQSSANMSLPTPFSQPPSFLDKVVLWEDQNKKPDEVTKRDETSKEAEEEDISTNSNMEGPISSANMSLPTSLSQPPSFSPKHQPHASILSQPRVPQPQSSHHHPSSSSLLETMGRPTTSQDK